MTVPVVRFTVAGHEGVAPSLGRAFTVVYDGDCKVCTRLSRALTKWDRNHRLEVGSEHVVCEVAVRVDQHRRRRRVSGHATPAAAALRS